MGCASCSNGKKPAGCRNNGYCSDNQCNKRSSFDWLSNLTRDQQGDFPFVEIRFKNGRKSFFKVPDYLEPKMGSLVIVQVDYGYDIGVVALRGELTRAQMRLKKVEIDDASIGYILRFPNQEEIERWHELQKKESRLQSRSRQMAMNLSLDMKISDVEFQADGRKAIFFYTADQRVDFRELIRVMASEFKIKIEMRQVDMRVEASRLGGIGICGRELCCSTWLTDFRKVSTTAARFQQLSLNPDRLNGQCGKLKCCLNYELNSYTQVLKKFPSTSIKLKTKKGLGVFQKMNIFSDLMWYSYETDRVNWFKFDVHSVNEIIKKNLQDIPVSKLEDFMIKEESISNQDFFETPTENLRKKNGKRNRNRRKMNETR
ncbi:MAG: regulatory iron-sulfur-containing complex subunit RicT [Flavobacteriaceae bacterium]|nr:regulatory iron-sulfur-containing complex subunit RicT [Flavobacteriaceae bacterium]MCY4266590.1 regulatory iron-sulfur-containing complex subunit RicT [Flavobacteriaceae bacterium]